MKQRGTVKSGITDEADQQSAGLNNQGICDEARSSILRQDLQAKEEADEESITRQGNPRKPEGGDGEQMLRRMNESHFAVTGWALGFWQIDPDDTVLDIGCGGGATLHRMGEKIDKGHLTGVDYSPVSVELSGKTNAALAAEGKLDVVEASVESLPFPDQSFDKIITVESFYFWPDPQENLKEVHRVLKKNGIFLLVADIYQTDRLTERELENIRRYNLYNPTKEEFVRLFERAGFSETIVHTEEGTSWICVEGRKQTD